MVVKLKHAFTYETNICSIECCLQKLEFSEKYQAELINFLVFMLLFFLPIPLTLYTPDLVVWKKSWEILMF